MLMENVRYSRALEITSSYIKYAVGYVSNNVPHLLYYKKKPIHGIVSFGRIVNHDKLVEALNEFHNISDVPLDFKAEPNAVSLVLPSLGFKVFQCDKASRVVASDDAIAPVDVENVMSLIYKQVVEQGNTIVDVVPNYYVANRQAFKEPPLGVKSETLTIRAKVYTLPQDLLTDFSQVVQDAGFRVLRSGVASYCASQLIKLTPGYPESYVLFDMGADLTTASFIGKGEPYSSRFIKIGGASLSEKISKELSIPLEEANSIKEKFGYDLNAHQFETPLYTGTNENGIKIKIYQKDVNRVIEDYFNEFHNYLDVALKQLNASNGQEYGAYPILLTGGGSRLKGIGNLLAPNFGTRKMFAYLPNVIGGREASATNVLGMIVAEGKIKKSNLIENCRGVSSLRRE